MTDSYVRDAGITSGAALEVEDAVRILSEGDLEIEGRLVDASNATLRAFVTLDGVTVRCVYKPVRGERPLWDFPDGTLAGREVAAYRVGVALGWDPVPPTVLRPGPFGDGACQLWIDEDESALTPVGFVPAGSVPEGWLPVASARDEAGAPYLLAHADDPSLARLALFDIVVNNADRKGGHLLVGGDGRLFAIDHGVCFHIEDKLRTVLWGWVGRDLDEEAAAALARLATRLRGSVGLELTKLITAREVAATINRVEALASTARFPAPGTDWPAIPWPPM